MKILFIYSNKILKIQNETFNNLKNLVNLRLDKNEIKELDKNSFHGLDNLKDLYLHSNKIQKIQNETFNNLKSLTFLILSENKITNIQDDALKGLDNLIFLQLNLNHLRFINENNFFYLIIRPNLSKTDSANFGFDSSRLIVNFSHILIMNNPTPKYTSFNCQKCLSVWEKVCVDYSTLSN